MTDEVLATISNLRKRANQQRTYSFISIAALTFVVIAGSYLFIFQSAKIAALDVEVQREVSGSGTDAVASLAELNIEYSNLLSKLDESEDKLQKISGLIYIDGNSDLDFKRVNFHKKTLYLGRSGIGIGFNFNNHKITRIELFKSRLEEINAYLSSPDLENNLLDKANKELSSLEIELVNVEGRIARTKATYESLKEQLPGEAIGTAQAKYAEALNSLFSESQEISVIRSELIDRINSKDFGDLSSLEKIQEAIRVNNAALARSDEVIEIIRESLKKHTESKTNLSNSIVELKNRIAYIEAERQLTSPNNNLEQQQNTNSKLAFFASSNLARLGIIVVVIFFAQIFFSIYKYSSKLSSFYHARVDILELLTQGNIVDKAQAFELIGPLAEVFTPDSFDFGKSPTLPLEKITSMLKAMPK